MCLIIQGMKKGGAERVLSVIANHFYRSGNEMILVLVDDGEDISYEIETGIKIIDLSNNKTKGLNRRIDKIVRLRKLLMAEKPDICISFLTKINIYSIISKIGINIPLIISERNNPVVDPKSFYTRTLRRLIYPFASGYVFQTEYASQYFSKGIRSKSVIIPNPITNKIYYLNNAEETKKEIVTVSRLEKQKNLPLLIKACANIFKKYPEYKLKIYGEGTERENLQELISKLKIGEKVKLMGQHDNVLELINSADIFALTSNYEGMPNALAEAMSIGLPCVATNCPAYGSAYLIKDKENGVLIPVGDQSKLEESLIEYIEDADLKNKISNEAFKIRDKLNEKRIMKEWEEYIMSFI